MPYRSQDQEAFFNANRKALESRGVNVDEWNKSSKGMKLPKRLGPRKMGAGRVLSGRSSKPARKHMGALSGSKG